MIDELKKSVEDSFAEAQKKAYGKLAEELKPKSPVLKNIFLLYFLNKGFDLL